MAKSTSPKGRTPKKGSGAQRRSRTFTARQQAFINHYIVHKNATKAAKLAGYSEKTAGVTGFDLLKNPEIRAEVDRRLAIEAKKVSVTAEDVIAELMKMAFVNMEDFSRVDSEGNAVLDLSEVNRDQWAAVQELTSERVPGSELAMRTKVKLTPKTTALDMLAKHLGLYEQDNRQRSEIKVTISREVRRPK